MLNLNEKFLEDVTKQLETCHNESEIRNVFKQNLPEGMTQGQKLYSHFQSNVLKDEKKLHETLGENIDWTGPQIVSYQMDYINRQAFEYFSGLSRDIDINQIFKEEIQNQKHLKKQEIKAEMEQKGNYLYHFSKHDINANESLIPHGCPDYPREEFINGVFAVPSNVGTYNLRRDFPDGHFYCDQHILLYAHEEDIDTTRGYGYGYKLSAANFTPTVSNSGIYAGEWTSQQPEKIIEKFPVNLEHIAKKGCQIYIASPELKNEIEGEIKDMPGNTREQKLEELASKGIITNLNKSLEQKKECQKSASKIMALRGFENPRNQKIAMEIGEKKLNKTGQALTAEDIEKIKIKIIGKSKF